MQYSEFIKSKTRLFESHGIDVDTLHADLFDFQRDIVRWALAKGRAAIFADCGLGKTLMQLVWAQEVHRYTDTPVIVLAPLAVAAQTVAEGEMFGISVNLCESDADIVNGINITNYDKLQRFDCSQFGGVVLDESSILKTFTGKIRTALIQQFESTPFRLACTATPAPNDYMELGNHAEFLGVMTRTEMLSMYFVHDSGETSKWRLKGHASDTFWEWMASWAVVVDNPNSIGYSDDGYELPAVNVYQCVVGGDIQDIKLSLTDRRKARKESLTERCQLAADLVNGSNEQWLVWCDLNDESATLKRLIPDAVEVKGSDKPAHKTDAMLGFSWGKYRCLVTKPSIAGVGMNWQNCRNMIFVGLSDSYEQYYQALRRCWRFGQTKEVNAYIVISAKEGAVKANIERKEADAKAMRDAMLALTKDNVRHELARTARMMTDYTPSVDMILPPWEEMIASASA